MPYSRIHSPLFVTAPVPLQLPSVSCITCARADLGSSLALSAPERAADALLLCAAMLSASVVFASASTYTVFCLRGQVQLLLEQNWRQLRRPDWRLCVPSDTAATGSYVWHV